MNSEARQQGRLAARPPLERMMRIHHAVQSGSFPNSTRLATDLEVSVKSIQRDVEFMRSRLNLPVEYDNVRKGFYYTEEVSAFPTMQITEGELFALVVAEKALQQYRGTSFEKPLLSAFKKMAASLPDTISVNMADWEASISFRTSGEPLLDLDIFNRLAKAAAHGDQLKLLYRKPGQRQGESRVVDPYHLANINGQWYLFAFDHLRRDLRTFVPARIQAAESTGKHFERPEKFSVERALKNSFGVHSPQGDFRVKIRFSAAVSDYIREKRWHPTQKLMEQPDGGLDLELSLSSLAEVERWILSWGGAAVPLAPPELVQMVKAAAARLVQSF